MLRVGAGSFLLDEGELKKYSLSCNEKPKPVNELKRYVVIEEQKFVPVDAQEGRTTRIEYAFAKEYAVSGWFQWSCKYKDYQVWRGKHDIEQ